MRGVYSEPLMLLENCLHVIRSVSSHASARRGIGEILDDEGRSASLRGETESQGVRLSSAQKRILGYISAETTLSDGVRCSKKELAKQAGCSVQTVDRAIFRLRKLGLVEVEECHAESGAQTANLYRAKR